MIRFFVVCILLRITTTWAERDEATLGKINCDDLWTEYLKEQEILEKIMIDSVNFVENKITEAAREKKFIDYECIDNVRNDLRALSINATRVIVECFKILPSLKIGKCIGKYEESFFNNKLNYLKNEQLPRCMSRYTKRIDSNDWRH